MRRFAALGRAYVAFAVDEPHLFRLVFGPTCVELMQAGDQPGPYRKLCDALDDLDRRRLLRRGIRPGGTLSRVGSGPLVDLGERGPEGEKAGHRRVTCMGE